MLSVEELIQEALSLPSISRALIVEKLIESLEFYILILALMHCSREPGYYKNRVRQDLSD